jgi:putative Mg2+ transporter-C (MgtC) family protein
MIIAGTFKGLLREVIAAARGKIALTFDDDLTCHGKVALTHDIIDIAIRLASALAAGSLLGFERSFHGRPAGIRTHALVCLASALLMLVPAYQATWLGIPLDSSSPSRMAQGIMTGIGFLGAGVIFQQGFFTVRGLTTAASVWLTAALGILFGIGFFYAAVIGTLAALGVLAALRWLEWQLPRQLFARLSLRFAEDKVMSEEDVRQLLSTCDFTVHQIDYRRQVVERGARFEYKMVVQTVEALNIRRLAEKLRATTEILEFHLSPTGD